MIRFVRICWPIRNTLLVNQYNTRPLGMNRKKDKKNTGMYIIIFCCIGSPPVAGVIRCWRNMLPPIKSGAT